MILPLLVAVPFGGGLLAWLVGRHDARPARWLALLALVAELAIVIGLWFGHRDDLTLTGRGPWLEDFNRAWIPQLGIRFHLALDGLSLLLVALTAFLGITAVLASWSEIQERVGLFHFQLLWVLAAIVGVFLALDLFLFAFFWEMMLIPMYFLIIVWGHEHRVYAAVKFFLFTQLSGLLMLVAIVALYFIHGRQAGTFTFEYTDLLGTALSPRTAMLLLLGFVAAFAVKLPAVPVHTWLPDAHTEAPTAGSVVLAGLMLKTGAYGLLRFAVPLFPDAAFDLAPVAMVLAVVGILYGALLAFSQTDLKRMVAYTSVSHMGFVLLAVFAWNELALQGAVVEILAHGLATGGLFILVGALQERIHTRDIGRMSGLWAVTPRMGGVAMVLALAALGLPGLATFVGEFLVLFGSFRESEPLTIVASLGIVAATVYALWLVQVAFHGPNREGWHVPDLAPREMATFAAMIAALVWIGLYPRPVLEAAGSGLRELERVAPRGGAVAPVDGRPDVSRERTCVPVVAGCEEASGAQLTERRRDDGR